MEETFADRMERPFLHCCWLTIWLICSFFSMGNSQPGPPGPRKGLYFMHNGSILLSGSSLDISDIGEQPDNRSFEGSTLVCVTSNINIQCCRTTDGGNVGEWRDPIGALVIRNNLDQSSSIFTRVGFTEQVRLSRRSDATGPVGRYTCAVPDSRGNNITAFIIITAPPTTPPPTTTPVPSDARTDAPNGPPAGTTNTPDSQLSPSTMATPSEGGGASNPTDLSSLSTTDTLGGDPRQSQGGGGNSGGVAAAIVIVLLVLLAIVGATTFLIIFWIRKRRAKVSGYSPERYLSFGKKDYLSSTKTAPPNRPKPYQRNGQQSSVEMSSLQSSAPVIEVFPEPTYAVEGEEVYLKVRVSGLPQPAITWTFNQQTISSDYSREIEDTGSITFLSCELSQTGTYTMVASNSAGKAQKLVVFTVRKEGEGLQESVDGGGVAGVKPLPIKEFGDYVAHLHSNNNKLFKSQFTSLDKGTDKSCAVSQLADNRVSNRFANIIVYDDDRVVLKTSPELSGCQGDYINASYIDGYSVPKKFIATQGPMPKTLLAFWRMMWQERPPTIVMVTNLVEGAKEKCTQYWPEQGSMEVGPFTVTITDQHKLADYTIRTFILQVGGVSRFGFGFEDGDIPSHHYKLVAAHQKNIHALWLKDDASKGKHKVRQFHFTSWPDHGVPDYASPLLTFYHRVCKEHPSNKGPIVCHCSAGVGRTGTFVGIDIILEQVTKEGVVNVVGVIKKMREQRVYMVQAVEQFVFLHDAVLESLTCGDTQISAGNLRTAMKRLGKVQSQTSGYDHEFKVLEQVSPRVEDAICSWAERFPQLNRNTDFLPVDRWRLGLSNEFSSYLHATIANGYKQQRAFILAQTPLPATIRNLWKVIYDSNVSAIVQLTELREEGKEVCTQYWPKKKGQLREFKDFEVDLISEEEALAGFTVRNLSVLEFKSQKAHQVIQFHITDWNGNGDCSNMNAVINVIDEVSKLQRRTGNHPIMVLCNDTVTRCAMFCSIYNTIERCKLEGVVDVFQAVKSLRIHRPGAIQTVDQYKAIFEALLVFLDSFSDYSNFI